MANSRIPQSFGHYVANVADTAFADGACDALWCPEAGILQLIREDGTQVAVTVTAGTLLPVRATRIESTGSTVSDQTLVLVCYYTKP